MSTETSELKKAIHRLQDALDQPKDEYIRDSVIQRFEFCVELSWKTAKKIMGSPTSAPKDIIREMAQSAYITDVETWLESIDMRNLSSHTYKEALAEIVYNFAKAFLPELQKFIKVLEQK